MRKTAKNETKTEGQSHLQLLVPLAELVRRDLREFVIASGMEALGKMLEQDRLKLCGPRHSREHPMYRAGTAPGGLVMGGRRVSLQRPRVRDADGEVTLPTWAQFSAEDPLEERAVEQMVLGVSTRGYGRSLEPLPDDLPERGTRRSSVSRRFKAATQKQLSKWLSQDLGELDLQVLMIDGIHFGKHVVLVAVGIDREGRKRVLGLWEGASENADSCKGLLANLTGRGLDTSRSYVFVIDGSKALRQAIRDVFGKRALVQRCQVHKRRNVLSHLPKGMHRTVGQALTQAYAAKSANVAQKRLGLLVRQLEEEYPSAATSLREGLDETLTVKALGLPSSLERTLSTTNPIENLNDGIRRVSRRVKRWRGGSMILRWVAASLTEAEKGFRRLRGYKEMPLLIAALKANDAQLDGTLDQQKEVA